MIPLHCRQIKSSHRCELHTKGNDYRKNTKYQIANEWNGNKNIRHHCFLRDSAWFFPNLCIKHFSIHSISHLICILSRHLLKTFPFNCHVFRLCKIFLVIFFSIYLWIPFCKEIIQRHYTITNITIQVYTPVCNPFFVS